MNPFRHDIRAARRLTLLLLVGAALGLLAGCAGPGWYAQAAAGHLQLVRGRTDIATALADPDTDPGLAARLAAAAEIRAFAVDELGLPAGDSYTQFVRTGRDAVTWNVVAAPEFSLQPRRWCFPVSGCVPYLGWFDAERAERHADRLAARGLDVAVAGAAAYSTLGWFDDPLPDTLLAYDEERLAAYLFHELAHRQLWVAGDPEFSESYASFVEEAAVEAWLGESGREARLPAWRQQRREAAQFDRLIVSAREDLALIYAAERPPEWKRQRKAEVFGELETRYRDSLAREGGGHDPSGGWFRQANNAHLALHSSYRGGHCAFETLYREAGRDFRRFARLARQRAQLEPAARQAWLEQPCEVIAR